jgi:hypothetical protein
MYVCICVHVCMYVCMYVCTYVKTKQLRNLLASLWLYQPINQPISNCWKVNAYRDIEITATGHRLFKVLVSVTRLSARTDWADRSVLWPRREQVPSGHKSDTLLHENCASFQIPWSSYLKLLNVVELNQWRTWHDYVRTLHSAIVTYVTHKIIQRK